MKVLLADEYGFCFGVERAVEMVEEAVAAGETVRSLGPVIHNKQEMQLLASKVVDATCPFVTRVQRLASRAAAADRHVIVVGSPDHPEMIGVKGYAPDHAFVIRDETEVADLPELRR